MISLQVGTPPRGQILIVTLPDNQTDSLCPVLDVTGGTGEAECDTLLPVVCVTKHCHQVDCCKMTRHEAWHWERHVQVGRFKMD